MSRDYYTPAVPFLYTAADSASGGGSGGGSNSGMDCLPLRCPPTTGPPGFLISGLITEQAKSLVALQELQHEVGALLEFRDLVIETFPNLRTKMAVSNPTTMTSHVSNIPIARREWEPGIRVRRRIQHKDGDNSPSRSRSNSHSSKQIPKSNTDTTSVVQDSGFSTETSSSKETHSASSTTGAVALQASTSKDSPDAEDELWNLLDVIQRKGTKLRDEVEALQGALCARNELSDMNSDFQRQLMLGNTQEDLRNLRRERDILLEKVADMESENLAGRVQASRLKADLESLLAAKIDLEEQLRQAVTQKCELNSRIHDLHLQFVSNKSAPNSPDSTNSKKSPSGGVGKIEAPARRRRTSSSSVHRSDGSEMVNGNKDSSISPKHVIEQNSGKVITATLNASVSVDDLNRLDEVLGHCDGTLAGNVIRVRAPDSNKIAAILKENNATVLQRNLLTATVRNQALKERLEAVNKLKDGLCEKLEKARDENDDLRFQLEERNIELQGTKARVRILEGFQLQKASMNSAINSTVDTHAPRIEQLSTPSMKAMIPLPLADEVNAQNSSSTESAHDQKAAETTPKRKPSRIPLPGSMSISSKSQPLSKNASSLPRPGSAQSGSSLSGSKSTSSIPGPKSSKSGRDSLAGRSSKTNDSLSKSRDSSTGNGMTPSRSASVCNKRDGLSSTRVRRINSMSRGSIMSDNDTKVRPVKQSFWSWLKILDNGPS